MNCVTYLLHMTITTKTQLKVAQNKFGGTFVVCFKICEFLKILLINNFFISGNIFIFKYCVMMK